MKNHLADMDGLRGIAAMAVVAEHMTRPFGLDIVPNGHLAVDFFFALSGFVVALSYEEKLRSGKMGFLAFLATRVRRLHPLILLGMAMGAMVYMMRFGAGPDTLTRLAGASVLGLFLIPTGLLAGPGYVSSHPLNPPSWSLFAEYVVNLFYAAFLRYLSTPVVAMLALIGVILTSVALTRYGTLDIGYSYDDWWWGLARVVFPFFCGVLLFRIWKAGSFTVPSIPFVVQAGLLAAMLAAPSHPVVQGAVVFCVIPILVCLGASSSSGTNARWSLKDWAGYLSYPVYIIHFPIIRVFSNLVRKFELDGAALAAAFVLEFCLILVAAFLVARLFEEPVRQWLGKNRLAPA